MGDQLFVWYNLRIFFPAKSQREAGTLIFSQVKDKG